jgi:hypothetical protein
VKNVGRVGLRLGGGRDLERAEREEDGVFSSVYSWLRRCTILVRFSFSLVQ